MSESGMWSAARWLKNQYARHKEQEDRDAAELIEALIPCYNLLAAGRQDEYSIRYIARVDEIAKRFRRD